MPVDPSLRPLPTTTGALLQELRANRETLRGMSADQLTGTAPIVDVLEARVRALFVVATALCDYVGFRSGADNLVETHTRDKPGQKAAVDATAAVFTADHITLVDNIERARTARLTTRKHGYRYNLCEDEDFFHQESGASASAVLVGRNLVVTAAHVLARVGDLTSLRFVFGFRVLANGQSVTEVETSEVFEARELIGVHFDKITGADWAVIGINNVTAHKPVPIRRTRAPVRPTPIYIVGHPNGLPGKFADDATMLPGRNDDEFHADLDATMGNSGSPVFSAEDDVVEGIYIGSSKLEEDEDVGFALRGCNVLRIVPRGQRTGQRCIRTACFEHLIPPLS